MIARAVVGAPGADPAPGARSRAGGRDARESVRASDTLEALRAEIERTDAALIATLAERMALAQRVGACKRAAGRPVLDPAREAAVVGRAAAMAREAGLPEGEVRAIYWRILAMSRRAQQGSDR